MTKRRLLLLSVLAAGVIVWVVLDVVASQVDGRFNRVGNSTMAISDRARKLHSKLTIVDLHCDALLWNRNLLERSSRGHVDIPRMLEGNVAIQTFSIVTKVPKNQNYHSNKSDSDDITLLACVERWAPQAIFSLKERALYQAHRLRDFANSSNGKFRLLSHSEDVAEFVKERETNQNCVAGILSIEGAHALENDVRNLDALSDAGICMIGIAHFFDNEFAGSAHGEHKGGLTQQGRELVKQMERSSIIVDVAHSSPAAIHDVLAVATKPIVASHTGVKGTCSGERNLSDAELRGIAKTGGLIGIGFWKTAVCGEDARAIARAMKYTARVAGIEHVALGSDFDGAVTAPFDCSKMIFVTQALIDEGFSDEEITAVMGGNAVRFFRQQLPRRASH